ncbi:copper resistance protein NlpE N-terminal domain-containing protein [Echinicola salinicaeni]|uniref:copper resistance protein NlpE N-terminal domain-containing protein n=1 Tax=Echinicola salinicaeni TaxID=2762757 RepID=UPI0016476B61|nr:copper resistance protein NlpE N-terminal domain-containing protein [Echinicola salinicaeni]
MKGSHLLSIISLFSLTIACDQPANETANQATLETESSSTADKILEKKTSTWYTYEGTIPCADCVGIKMVLQLENNPDEVSREFRLKETYLGTTDGDRSFETSGTYEVSYGMKGDPGAMLISLIDENDQQFKTFLQEKDGIHFTLLDKDKNKIDSNLNYTLTQK